MVGLRFIEMDSVASNCSIDQKFLGRDRPTQT